MDPPLSTEWQSIRPWALRLSLSVREITSVSATFILSSALSEQSGEHDPSLSSLGLTIEDEHTDHDGDAVGTSEPRKKTVISDALSKGLSVNVNGAPWQRVLLRIDDKTDEAVIILYGLMPGRQYDIDLGLVQGGHTNLHKQVVTEDSELPAAESHTDPEEVSTFDPSPSSSDHPPSTPSTSPSHTLPSTPPNANGHGSPNNAPITLEAHLSQLQHALSLLTCERDTLTASLKSARRDAQKADASLRSEIDVLKRASEKHSATEHRARQKVLALQEAVKRAQTATKEMEDLVKEVEGELPCLMELKNEKEAKYHKVKEVADSARKEMEKSTDRDKKRVDSMKGELTGLNNKVERLNAKKDKLEGSIIPDLEEQLKEIEREIEKAESSYGYPFPALDGMADHGVNIGDLSGGSASDLMLDQSPYSSHVPVQKKRSPNSQPLGAIGRPAPIQRPLNLHQQLWSPGRPAPQSSIPNSLPHAQPPRQPSLKNTPQAQSISQHAQHNSGSSNSSSSSTPIPGQTSTLSSRAPPFEPGRALRVSLPSGSSSTLSSRHSIPPPLSQRTAQMAIGAARGTGSNGKWADYLNYDFDMAGQNTYDGGRGG